MEFIDALWYFDSALDIVFCDPLSHKYLNIPNLCNIIITG